ncbi:MAG: 4Fe-4S binding protein [Clostridia bacterium]|nr:4Fe-4S binding protein [Clostridia bacterium]
MACVTIREDICKGCGLCAHVCPKKILEINGAMNAKGYRPAAVQNEADCIGCAFCALMCPDVAIKVEK